MATSSDCRTRNTEPTTSPSGRTRAARHRCALHHLHPPGCRTRRVYRAMSRRERVSSGLRELQPSSPLFQQTPSFQALDSNPIHLSLEKLGFSDVFQRRLFRRLRRGSVVFGLSIAGRSLYRTGAEVPRARWPARSDRPSVPPTLERRPRRAAAGYRATGAAESPNRREA